MAGVRAIPLVIRSEIVDRAVGLSPPEGILKVKPRRNARAGIVIKGNEVYSRLVEDRFEPILRRMTQIGSEVVGVVFGPDDAGRIEREIRNLLSNGADLLVVTGGMSVDPEDVTRQAISQAGAREFLYGTPVLPGAMFMISFIGNVSVLGIPACGLYHEATVFDLVLPKVLAGERLTRKDLAELGHGGLCLHCTECRYLVCPFGKGH